MKRFFKIWFHINLVWGGTIALIYTLASIENGTFSIKQWPIYEIDSLLAITQTFFVLSFIVAVILKTTEE
jgi:hypothetical protein